MFLFDYKLLIFASTEVKTSRLDDAVLQVSSLHVRNILMSTDVVLPLLYVVIRSLNVT